MSKCPPRSQNPSETALNLAPFRPQRHHPVLASISKVGETFSMNTAAEIHDLALKLPQRSRLKLAGELLRSVTPETSSRDLLDEAFRRENEIESGKVTLLDESEFWRRVANRRARP